MAQGNNASAANSGDNVLEEKISRRQMIKLVGAGSAGLLLGAGGMSSLFATGVASFGASTATTSRPPGDVLPFYGTHQQGITTPQQDFIYFAAFDVVTKRASDLRDLFKTWSHAAANMSQGKLVDAESNNPMLPPVDTGEAVGLSASKLTITFGVGPSLFAQNGMDRFRLASKRPAALVELPKFSGDNLQPEICGGDIGVQVCANDPQVAFHAIRNLIRLSRGVASIRWSQSGFQRTQQAAGNQPETPRNLMGFKDGTGNPDATDPDAMNDIVWVSQLEGPAWMTNGSYMVVRRIRMRVESWDRATLSDQEATFGRTRGNGAPLGQRNEFDALDLEKKGTGGKPVIPQNSHAALAHMSGKVKILRRGYSYTNGIDPKTGQLDSGLLFVAFQKDPRKQFIPMQQVLASKDALNEYIEHVGSAVFAVLPGAAPGGYVGQNLF